MIKIKKDTHIKIQSITITKNHMLNLTDRLKVKFSFSHPWANH